LKDIIKRELFWLFVGIVISFITAFLFLELLKLTSAAPNPNEVEKVFTVQLYMIGFVISLGMVYVIRAIVSAIKSFL
jgi:hypothetical protein